MKNHSNGQNGLLSQGYVESDWISEDPCREAVDQARRSHIDRRQGEAHGGDRRQGRRKDGVRHVTVHPQCGREQVLRARCRGRATNAVDVRLHT